MVLVAELAGHRRCETARRYADRAVGEALRDLRERRGFDAERPPFTASTPDVAPMPSG